jgi:hypothetical protein
LNSLIAFSLFSGIAGPVTGSGFVITDDSHLAPNSETLEFTDLIDMSMTLNNIPVAPATTTFTRADLDAPDLRSNGTNADGYAIEGWSAFNFVLCHGPAEVVSCGNSPQLDRLVIQVESISPVPEPATLTLVALGALGGRRLLRRRARA